MVRLRVTLLEGMCYTGQNKSTLRRMDMRDWIDVFGKRKTNIGFRAAKLEESTAELSNPARGWYQIHTFLAEQEPDFEELRWCLHPKDTLAFLLIDIGYFRDRDLDQEVLDRICRIFSFFSERSEERRVWKECRL